ncbi:hypothetical protein [Leucobacter soli]|uniref:hypothetical protein n=1 Tax=Leucobacter soli TaxID=2812850 RepID=UPI00360D4BF5
MRAPPVAVVSVMVPLPGYECCGSLQNSLGERGRRAAHSLLLVPGIGAAGAVTAIRRPGEAWEVRVMLPPSPQVTV